MLSEFIFTVFTPKIRVDYIEIGYGDIVALRTQIERHIDGDIGLSRAVMTAEYG